MLIENEFVVQAPAERVWAHLLDVERVALCMPGAQLTEVVDDHTWKGKTTIKVGPVSLAFAGTVVMEERDDVAHRVVLNAKGMEQRGKGAASARVESHLEEAGNATKVVMKTDLTISGAVAQYGRGMLLDISQRLTREFADCLQASMAAEGATQASSLGSPLATEEAAPPPGTGDGSGQRVAARTSGPTPRPAGAVGGLRLFVWALWRAVVRLVRRLIGGRR